MPFANFRRFHYSNTSVSAHTVRDHAGFIARFRGDTGGHTFPPSTWAETTDVSIGRCVLFRARSPGLTCTPRAMVATNIITETPKPLSKFAFGTVKIGWVYSSLGNEKKKTERKPRLESNKSVKKRLLSTEAVNGVEGRSLNYFLISESNVNLDLKKFKYNFVVCYTYKHK